MKVPTKGPTPGKCRWITYLLTLVVAIVQQHVVEIKFFPSKQKGNSPNGRGTEKNQLLTNIMFLENCKEKEDQLEYSLD